MPASITPGFHPHSSPFSSITAGLQPSTSATSPHRLHSPVLMLTVSAGDKWELQPLALSHLCCHLHHIASEGCLVTTAPTRPLHKHPRKRLNPHHAPDIEIERFAFRGTSICHGFICFPAFTEKPNSPFPIIAAQIFKGKQCQGINRTQLDATDEVYHSAGQGSVYNNR